MVEFTLSCIVGEKKDIWMKGEYEVFWTRWEVNVVVIPFGCGTEAPRWGKHKYGVFEGKGGYYACIFYDISNERGNEAAWSL